MNDQEIKDLQQRLANVGKNVGLRGGAGSITAGAQAANRFSPLFQLGRLGARLNPYRSGCGNCIRIIRARTSY